MTREYKNTRTYTSKRVYRDKSKMTKKPVKKLSYIEKVLNGIKKFFNK